MIQTRIYCDECIEAEWPSYPQQCVTGGTLEDAAAIATATQWRQSRGRWLCPSHAWYADVVEADNADD